MPSTKTIEQLRAAISTQDPSLVSAFDALVEKARFYETIRNESCDDHVICLADDGTAFFLKGENLDQALTRFMS